MDEYTSNETTISDALESLGLSADEVTLDAFLGHFLRTWGVDLESLGSVTMLPDFSTEAGTSGSVLSEGEMRQAQDSAEAMLTEFPDHVDAAASLIPEAGATVSGADLRGLSDQGGNRCPHCGQLLPLSQGNNAGSLDTGE